MLLKTSEQTRLITDEQKQIISIANVSVTKKCISSTCIQSSQSTGKHSNIQIHFQSMPKSLYNTQQIPTPFLFNELPQGRTGAKSKQQRQPINLDIHLLIFLTSKDQRPFPNLHRWEKEEEYVHIMQGLAKSGPRVPSIRPAASHQF